MLIHELTTAQCEEVLARTSIGRLACVCDDQPYVVPISLYFEPSENALYSFSSVGQKIDWMRGNPKVCVEVDEIHERLHWTTVVMLGRYEEIGHSEQENDARRRAYDLFVQRADWWLPGVGKLTIGEGQVTPVIYRIRLDTITGRRAAREASYAPG
jgi:nitroimidazol reductase NimA-like FMN-containing flavoprotein (pyridoxamine 5'-phosphate oxidase superfamily)